MTNSLTEQFKTLSKRIRSLKNLDGSISTQLDELEKLINSPDARSISAQNDLQEIKTLLESQLSPDSKHHNPQILDLLYKLNIVIREAIKKHKSRPFKYIDPAQSGLIASLAKDNLKFTGPLVSGRLIKNAGSGGVGSISTSSDFLISSTSSNNGMNNSLRDTPYAAPPFSINPSISQQSDEAAKELRASIIDSVLSKTKKWIDDHIDAEKERLDAILKNNHELIALQLENASRENSNIMKAWFDDFSTKEEARFKVNREEFIRVSTEMHELHSRQFASDSERLNELIVKADELQKRVNKVFEDANRQALAQAFKEEREALEDSATRFLIAFTLSILLLFGGALYISLNFEVLNLSSLALKVTIAAPIIWLSWFFGRQYSYAKRLASDYSFKSASALAYQGYRNQVVEADPMHQKLLDIAITNYGRHPESIAQGSKDFGSPAHELWVKLIDKLDLKTVAELLAKAGDKAK